MITSRRALPTVVLLAALAVGAVSLTGCSAGSTSSSGGSAQSTVVAPEPGSVGVAGGGTGEVAIDGSGTKAGDTGTAGSSSVDRSVIVTGTVTVTAADPLAAAAKAASLVEAAGGRVDGRTENAAANGDRGSAILVLRIPAAKLSATLAALKKLGRADQVQIDSTDVTTQTQDLDARITALRATIARLLQLESTATDTTNLIAIETAIGDRQGDLESLEAQQRGLTDQVSMSTITLQLRSDAAAPPIKPADFWSGLGTGWSAFIGFWAGALVVLGVVLPWLVFLAAAGAVTVVVVKTVRRRRRSGTAVVGPVTTPNG